MRSMVGMGMASSITAKPLMYSSSSSCVTLSMAHSRAEGITRGRSMRAADAPSVKRLILGFFR